MIRPGRGWIVVIVVSILALAAPTRTDGSDGLSGAPSALPCGPTAMAIALRRLGLPVRSYELGSLADSDGISSMQQLRDYAASSRQAHALEWVLIAAGRQLLSESPLHLTVEWLILQTEGSSGR